MLSGIALLGALWSFLVPATVLAKLPAAEILILTTQLAVSGEPNYYLRMLGPA